ncbi:hypothetical protein ACJIZ3_015683 [Penstemon smallii]|uniref:OCRE domain-containing protein n=1 Tax=Penstemon smallii TaxID=265156 RepID=A0ABD3RN67_9LAMI
MAEGSSSGNRKRSFIEDDDSNKPPAEKRVRFPKGKKLKQGDYVPVSKGEDVISNMKDARLISRERAMRRSKITTELLNDEITENAPDIRKAEVKYKKMRTCFLINLDCQTLTKRSVDVEPKYAKKSSITPNDDGKTQDLRTEELAEINRRIADALEPGETVLRALRRLKGSTDKKQKMSAETKQLFDQLTEDAMKLMENGDYNVYEEKQESFKREAEGYEKLVNTRKQGLSESMVLSDDFDIFADDDANAAGNLNTNGSGSISAEPSESGDQQNDYVYDESSGYYYSSSLGYYYDPSTGFYCSAASGKWYSYNQESGTYDEVQQEISAS